MLDFNWPGFTFMLDFDLPDLSFVLDFDLPGLSFVLDFDWPGLVLLSKILRKHALLMVSLGRRMNKP